MIVTIEVGVPVGLRYPEDLKSFKVVINPALRAGDAYLAALSGVGESASDNEVWVFQPWVIQASGMEHSAGWRADFGKMLEFAKKHGWVRQSDGAIRAHVEWVSEAV